MIRRILLVVDPGGGALAAGAAIDWASRLGARLRALYLFDARPGTSGLPSLRMFGPTGWRSAPLLPEDALAEARARADEQVASLVDQARASGVAVEAEVVIGDVVDEVADRAPCCDLVALAAGDVRDGDALADAAQQLARRVDVPMLVGALDQPRTGAVVSAFDGTQESWRALRVAAELAGRTDRAALVTVSVEPDPLASVAAIEGYLEAHVSRREAVVARGHEHKLAALARTSDAAAVVLGLSARFHLGELLHPTHLEVFTTTRVPLVLCPR